MLVVSFLDPSSLVIGNLTTDFLSQRRLFDMGVFCPDVDDKSDSGFRITGGRD